MIYWIIACTHDQLDLHKYHRQYPEGMTLVENNPHWQKRTTKTSITQWKNKAKLCNSISTLFLPNVAVKVGILACRKCSKVPKHA